MEESVIIGYPKPIKSYAWQLIRNAERIPKGKIIGVDFNYDDVYGSL